MIKPYTKFAALFIVPGYIFWIFLVAVSDDVGVFYIIGLVLWFPGCWAFAKSKGYHWAWGLLGILNIGGPIILLFFRDKTKEDFQQNDQIPEQKIEDAIEFKLRNSNTNNIRERWNSLDSEELKAVYEKNDREEWIDEVFQTIEQILRERSVQLPKQKRTQAMSVEQALARLSHASSKTRVVTAMELLQSPNYKVRIAIASEIASLQITDVGVWHELANALADNFGSVGEAAAKAFWLLKELGGVSYAIRSLRDEHENRANITKGIHCLLTNAPDKKIFFDLLKENWEDCPVLQATASKSYQKIPFSEQITKENIINLAVNASDKDLLELVNLLYNAANSSNTIIIQTIQSVLKEYVDKERFIETVNRFPKNKQVIILNAISQTQKVKPKTIQKSQVRKNQCAHCSSIFFKPRSPIDKLNDIGMQKVQVGCSKCRTPVCFSCAADMANRKGKSFNLFCPKCGAELGGGGEAGHLGDHFQGWD